MGYSTGFYTTIELSSGLSPSSLSSYTAWISAEAVSAAALASIQANARADLNDVRFSTDAAGDSPLALFKILANPAGGKWAFLVGPINYTGGAAFTLYMHWGDASLTTDTSSSAVFPANVLGAWSPRSSGLLTDMSANARTLTAAGSVGTSDNSHPSGAYAFSADSYDDKLSCALSGTLLNGTDASIELIAKWPDGDTGWMAALSSSSRYLGLHYSDSTKEWAVHTKYGNRPIDEDELLLSTNYSSDWTYLGAVWDDSGPYISGRAVGEYQGPDGTSDIASSATTFSVFNNPQSSSQINGSVVLAIVRNVDLSSDWMRATDRLANDQDAYVTYGTTVSSHGGGPTDVEIEAAPVAGAGSLLGTPTFGVLLEAQAIAAAGAAGGAHILSVLKGAPAIAAAGSLQGQAQAGAGVTVQAAPIAGSGALSGTGQLSALIAADPLAATGAVLGGHVISARITATAVTATGAVVGQVQAGAGVLISGDPVAAAGSLAGLEVLSVRQSAAAIGAAGILSGYAGLQVQGGPVEAGGTVLGEQLVEYVVSGAPISAEAELGARLVLSVLQAADALLAVGAVEGVVLATGSALDDITGAQAYLLDQGRQARVLDTGVDAFIVSIQLDAVVIH